MNEAFGAGHSVSEFFGSEPRLMWLYAVLGLVLVGLYLVRLFHRPDPSKLRSVSKGHKGEQYGALRKRFCALLCDVDVSTYESSARQLSLFVREEGFITTQDLLRHNAKKLFHIHREWASLLEGGMAVRFTVMYNLFGGTVMNLGDEEQQRQLTEIFSKGELGCFALTECGAGVLSGLVVETTAKWQADGTYDLHTPSDSAVKNWISSGLVADWAVVIARLLIPDPDNAGKELDKGPHAFLVRLPDLPKPTFERKDMPAKVDFNGLDNATLRFTHCQIPHSALLQGISSVDKSGKYVLKDPKVPFRFEHVAQRLLSGRICIAGAALSQLRFVMESVKNYKRNIPTGKDQTTPLTQLPSFKALLDKAQAIHDVFVEYLDFIETEYSTAKTITPRLVDEIACAKVLVVEFAIEMTMKIKAAVGSFSLQKGSPFGTKTDILYVFRFAEGDTGILMQKISRDAAMRAKPLSLLKSLFTVLTTSGLERNYHIELLRVCYAMLFFNKKIPNAKLVAWLNTHESVNRFAWIYSYRTIRNRVLSHNPQLHNSKELAFFDCYYEKLL